MRIEREVELEAKRLEGAAPINPGEDTVKSEFKTQKMSKAEAAEVFEKALRDSTGSLASSENTGFGEK